MKFNWIFLVSLGAWSNAHASVHLSQEAQVIDPAHAYLKQLSQDPELVIDHVNSLGYEVYGPVGLQASLEARQVPFVLSEPVKNVLAGKYPSAEESTQSVKDLAAKYPSLISLIEIGKSKEGRSLTVARITAPSGQGAPLNLRPEFKYIANMHGDEIVGREMMVKLIADLASTYGKDIRITQILNSTQVYILNSMNPDGATHRIRYNANGVDLNRSFPDFTTSDHENTTAGRESEIEAVMKFQAAHHFKLSANFHGGSEVVNYPWDTQVDVFPLDNLAQKLSLDYAKRATYIYQSTEFKNGITNGHAWYEIKGGMQDWSYNWHNDLQLTIEVTRAKYPGFETVARTYQANRDSLLTLIEDIHQL